MLAFAPYVKNGRVEGHFMFALGYVQFTLFLLISDLIRSDQIRSEKISSDQISLSCNAITDVVALAISNATHVIKSLH